MRVETRHGHVEHISHVCFLSVGLIMALLLCILCEEAVEAAIMRHVRIVAYL